MFQQGEEIRLVRHGNTRADARLTVVRDNVSEITLADRDGKETTFAHKAEHRGWKMLFKGLGDERCYSKRGPTYSILAVR